MERHRALKSAYCPSLNGMLEEAICGTPHGTAGKSFNEQQCSSTRNTPQEAMKNSHLALHNYIANEHT